MISVHGRWANVEAFHPYGDFSRPAMPLKLLANFRPQPEQADEQRWRGCLLDAKV
jgi:hypothetical protein